MNNDKEKSYKFPEETIPSLDLLHHLDDMNEIKFFLEKLKIRIKNTRIDRYIIYFEKLVINDMKELSLETIQKIFNNSNDERFKTPHDYHLYILREVHELQWIFKGLKIIMPKGVENKLKTIISGKDFAALDSSTNSRNTQFELRIASYFCQYGCTVDMSTETDIIIYTKKQIFYIECKRIGNEKKLVERISEARKQLERRMPKKVNNKDLYGCIAIDVTKVAFSHNGLTFATCNEHSRDNIQEKLIEIEKNLQYAMEKNFEKFKYLSSFWFQIHIPILIQHPYSEGTRFSSFHNFRSSLKLGHRRSSKVFKKIFESGSSKIDHRSTISKKLELQSEYIIPKGTSYDFDSLLLKEYIENREEIERDPESIIGSINMNLKLCEFVFSEFREVVSNINNKEKEALRKLDDSILKFELIMKMYVQRYPYKSN